MVDAAVPGPMPFRLLLDEAMQRLRRTWRPVYWRFALPLAALTALVAVAQALWMTSLFEQIDQESPDLDLGLTCGFYAVIFLSTALQGILFSAMGMVTVDVVAGREVRIRERLGDVLRLRVLWTLFITGFLMGLSFMCCFIPAIYVVPLLSFVLPVVADEGITGGEALRRGARLARYNPGRQFLDNPMTKIFLLLFVGWVLSAAVSMVVQMPLGMAQQWSILRQIGEEGAGTGEFPAMSPLLLWLQVPASLVSGLFTAAVGLYLSYGIALLFFDTRERKEGGDLEAAIAEIEGKEPHAELPLPPTEPL